MDINLAERFQKSKEKLVRRQKLMQLLQDILSGKIDSSRLSEENLGNSRQPYVSINDRSSYNYGYMTTCEMPYTDARQ